MTTIQTGKLAALFHSRKFWALISSEVGLTVATYFHGMPVDQAILAGVAALATYMISTAIEDAGTTTPPTVVINHTASSPPTITTTSGGQVNATAAPGLIVGGNPPHVT